MPQKAVAQAAIRLATVVITFRNGNDDRQMDKKWTNEQMELHQIRKQLSYDGDLSPCQV